MRHSTFLKVVSQELHNGRMVDVNTVAVCRCGRRYPDEEQLQAHIMRPDEPVEVQTREPQVAERAVINQFTSIALISETPEPEAPELVLGEV